MTKDKYRGALLGLACGDALGTTLEFQTPGTFTKIDDIVGGGPFGLEAGQWTDDTSMALCLADSLIVKRDFDLEDQINRYLDWYKNGYMSSTGSCFDIGMTVSSALRSYMRTGNPISGSTHEQSSGNGSIMRLVPVPMAFISNPKKAIELSGKSSISTHGSQMCIDSCRYMGGLIVGALLGHSKGDILGHMYTPLGDGWKQGLHSRVSEVASGSFKDKMPPEIKGTGFVIDSLEAALWAFYNSDSFEEGCLMAVNLGNDADTTGAVYGQIAGAYYGMSDIPENWLKKLAKRDLIVDIADSLKDISTVRRFDRNKPSLITM